MSEVKQFQPHFETVMSIYIKQISRLAYNLYSTVINSKKLMIQSMIKVSLAFRLKTDNQL